MSIHAGELLHIGGRNVIDRIQSAGLGDVRVPTEVIREVGNREVVDKVPGDPDFTFTLETLDVSTELEAWLTGSVGTGTGSGAAPGAADPDGTAYSWLDCSYVNILSPWKRAQSLGSGTVEAGHVIPGYYVNRIRYRYGVTDNASEEVELGGGAFYYAERPPVEQFEAGTGSAVDFAATDPAIGYRKGGAEGTSFRRVFGVIVDGEIMVAGTDYTETGAPNDASASAVTVHFAQAPVNGADIRFCYFTSAAQAWPQAVHASTVVKPGAVRGRNICVKIGSGLTKVSGVQAFELEATVDGDIDREFCNEEPIGRTINGRDTNGSVTVRAKSKDSLFDMFSRMFGIPRGEVVGFLNTHDIPLQVEVQNPKNPAQILKTLYVEDAIFQPPGTPARVNAPTDFEIRYESRSGKYVAFKGARA